MMQDDHGNTVIWPAGDGSYDGLPPPGSRVGNWLERRLSDPLSLAAAGKEDTAYDMAEFVELVVRYAYSSTSGLWFGDGPRKRILDLMLRARDPVLALFTTPADRRLAAKGFEATDTLIRFLVLTGEQRRALLVGDAMDDIRDHAQWLRNALGNIDLVAEIKRRAAV
ncbi:MAG: hypothetical protein R3D02_06110 [Hyphomicrobiales bacterium]